MSIRTGRPPRQPPRRRSRPPTGAFVILAIAVGVGALVAALFTGRSAPAASPALVAGASTPVSGEPTSDDATVTPSAGGAASGRPSPSPPRATGTPALPDATASPQASARPPGDVTVARDVPFTPDVRCGASRCQLELDVWRAEGVTDGPLIVMLHGRPRTRADMEPLARLLARDGAVVFNADYRGGPRVERGYPMAYEDAACAVRFARAHATEYGANPDRVVLVGHSFGTYVGSIVTLRGDRYRGGCLADTGSAEPEAFVGLSGSYHWHKEPIWNTFFGTRYAADPERWEEGHPYEQIGGNPDSVWRFVTEREDPVLDPDSSLAFHLLLEDAGYDTELQTLDGSGHFTILELDGDARIAAGVIAEVAGLDPE